MLRGRYRVVGRRESEEGGRCCCGDVATCNGNKTCLFRDRKRDEQTERQTGRRKDRQTYSGIGSGTVG